MRLSLIEDHVPLTDELMVSLTRQGYAVDRLADGRNVAVQGVSEPCDLITLDLGLSGCPGLEILQEWRGLGLATSVPIFITRGPWAKRIDGFKAGVDDHLTELFHPEELALCIRALLRRAHGLASQSQLEAAGLCLDEQHQCVYLNGVDVDLTATEFRLLYYFMLHPGQVLSKGHLVEHLYDGETGRGFNVIEVHVSHLRCKLGHEAIETCRGQGYRYVGVVAG